MPGCQVVRGLGDDPLTFVAAVQIRQGRRAVLGGVSRLAALGANVFIAYA